MEHQLVGTVQGAIKQGTQRKEIRSLQQAKNISSFKCGNRRRLTVVANPTIPYPRQGN